MIRIHISRHRETLGIYSPEEVSIGLKSGKFFPSDLGWKSGMEEWIPLEKFQDLPEVSEIKSDESNESPALAIEGDIRLSDHLPKREIEPAWERRQSLGFGTAIYQTILQVLTSPGSTFAKMKQSGGLGTPLIYFLVIGVAVTFVSAVYQGIWNTYFPSEMLKSTPTPYSPTIFWMMLAGICFFFAYLLNRFRISIFRDTPFMSHAHGRSS